MQLIRCDNTLPHCPIYKPRSKFFRVSLHKTVQSLISIRVWGSQKKQHIDKGSTLLLTMCLISYLCKTDPVDSISVLLAMTPHTQEVSARAKLN